jgi:hypothetical protein
MCSSTFRIEHSRVSIACLGILHVVILLCQYCIIVSVVTTLRTHFVYAKTITDIRLACFRRSFG